MDKFEEEQQSREKLLSQGYISQEEYDSMLEESYQEALMLESQGTAESLLQASKAFAALGSYKDSNTRSAASSDNGAKLANEEKRKGRRRFVFAGAACFVLVVIVAGLCSFVYQTNLNEAQTVEQGLKGNHYYNSSGSSWGYAFGDRGSGCILYKGDFAYYIAYRVVADVFGVRIVINDCGMDTEYSYERDSSGVKSIESTKNGNTYTREE